jgi:hypothetical protein
MAFPTTFTLRSILPVVSIKQLVDTFLPKPNDQGAIIYDASSNSFISGLSNKYVEQQMYIKGNTYNPGDLDISNFVSNFPNVNPGDYVIVGFPQISYPDLMISGIVSSPNTVTLQIYNFSNSIITTSNTAINIRVLQSTQI